ncbi:MAG: hypothetical protein EYC69_14000 [Bacteroidetes bacterium]|nr:MAG: hypothetical protein EYC69_14000 [Bacteroidota bacterium]
MLTIHFDKFAAIVLSILLVISSLSCKEKRKEIHIDENELREQLMDANKNLLRSEFHLIDSFIQAHNYQMKETGSGLRYQIVKNVEGRQAIAGDEVLIRYKAFLLNGELCQQSPNAGPEEVKLGEARLNRGLEEALLLMKEGEVARLVIPSHLGYGIRGDGKLIPPASILYYEINLMAIKK